MSAEPSNPPALPNFDRIAAAYSCMERLTFGRALVRTREHFLPRLQQCRRALVLGDGDGRFTAQLLGTNPAISVHAVDISPRMLRLLSDRVQHVGPRAAARLATQAADARTLRAPLGHYDLVVTHFVLDCFTQPDLDNLVRHITPCLQPGALWLLSEFAVPPQGFMRLLAPLIIRSLYFAFRLLTSLRVARLPDHITALRANGFVLEHEQLRLHGLLVAQLWRNSH